MIVKVEWVYPGLYEGERDARQAGVWGPSRLYSVIQCSSEKKV